MFSIDLKALKLQKNQGFEKFHMYVPRLDDQFRLGWMILTIVLRTGPDREVGPWKSGTGMKTNFLSIKNRAYVAIPWTAKTEVGPQEPCGPTP